MRVIVLLAVGVLAAGIATVAAGADVSTGATGNPRFRATLRADGHVVKAGTPWRFVVRSWNLANRPIPGTAIVRVRRSGRIVDTVGWFGFKRGVVQRTYRWSKTLRGRYALLEAKVIGPGGTRTLAYRVRIT